MRINRLLPVIIIFAVLAGCAKKGDTGPAGPAGPTGSTGPAGSGVANISINIYHIPPTAWSAASGSYSVTISDASITNADSDAVEASIGSGTGTWIALPTVNIINSGDNIGFSYLNRLVTLNYIYSSAPSIDMYLKVIVIPPAIMKQHPNVDWKDYSQAEAIINGINKRRD